MLTRLHHVVEIGAGDVASSALSWATHADRVSLYEPNVLLWSDLMRGAAGLDNVTARNMAVSDVGGNQPLYHLGLGSYLAGAPSFYATSIEPEGVPFIVSLARAVEVITINQAVPEDTDLLIITIGGGEWRLLAPMTMRPKTIETAHYCHNAAQWADTHRTWDWLQGAGYVGMVMATNQHSTFHRVRWTLTP
jgi:hypothetical protein